jgi:glycosyltransferase involved in cell wall biosynthesis
MNWPDVTVLIVTYDRPREIRETVGALLQFITYDGHIHWHIADDSSPGPYIEDIQRDYAELGFTATRTDRAGWGANVNKALQFIKDDYIFLIEDDYVAQRDIDLNRGVAVLDTHKHLGVIRYDGVTGHNGLVLILREAKTPVGTVPYMEIDHARSTHLNIYSNRPHLRHRRLHDTIGLYGEGKPLGLTETAYAHRVRNRDDCPKFAVLNDGISNAFDHIGVSRQGKEQDVFFKRRIQE